MWRVMHACIHEMNVVCERTCWSRWVSKLNSLRTLCILMWGRPVNLLLWMVLDLLDDKKQGFPFPLNRAIIMSYSSIRTLPLVESTGLIFVGSLSAANCWARSDMGPTTVRPYNFPAVYGHVFVIDCWIGSSRYSYESVFQVKLITCQDSMVTNTGPNFLLQLFNSQRMHFTF